MVELPYVLVQYNDINSLLYIPINSTNRIKYSCFTVSQNYIALGSTIGSIYLFCRESCKFMQLIPLSDGGILHIAISPDEKTIAFATNHGSVCLIALKPSAKLVAISTEHAKSQITCLCWNDNSSEIYIGDNNGRVSVMVHSIFTVNGMFQAPSYILMNLDSSIIQMDFRSSLLLVSTLTRCFISDTINEQYKQIGHKVRNGEFGACFFEYSDTSIRYNNQVSQKNGKNSLKKGLFNFIQENNTHIMEEQNIKIFCARPSSRIWEVSTNGTVIKTHQFKEALAIPPSQIFQLNDKMYLNKYQISMSTENLVNQENEILSPQSINFPNLSIIGERYIFSWLPSGLYIIDSVSATVVLWNNEFSNIVLAQVIGNAIYLMTSDITFHCLSFMPISDLILQFFKEKLYHSCLHICSRFGPKILKSMSSNDTNSLPFEESKEVIKKRNICERIIEIYKYEKERSFKKKADFKSDNENELLLQSLILLLESNSDEPSTKLQSGIVVVNSGSLLKDSHLHKSSLKSDTTQDGYSSIQPNEENQILKAKNVEVSCIDSLENNFNCIQSTMLQKDCTSDKEVIEIETETPNNITCVKRELEKLRTMINTISSEMIEDKLEETVLDIEKFLIDLKQSLSLPDNFTLKVIKNWEIYYYKFLLSNSSVIQIKEVSSDCIIQALCRAFIEINIGNILKCSCGYPYPMDNTITIEFLELGNALLKKNKNNVKSCLYICRNIPHMWQEYISIYIEEKLPLGDILRECIQAGDSRILSIILPKLNEEEWKNAMTYLETIVNRKCLFCSKSIQQGNKNDKLYDWTDVLQEILKGRGIKETIAFLERLESTLHHVTFDRSIFQSLIYTKILSQYKEESTTFDFSTRLLDTESIDVCSLKIWYNLVKAIEKDLHQIVNRSEIKKGPYNWGMVFHEKSQVCPCCTLSLETPILLGSNGIAIFPCNHAYHMNCMLEKGLFRCNLHT